MRYRYLSLFFASFPLLLSAQATGECTGIDSTAQVYKVVREMPLFPGCTDLEDYPLQKRCAEEALNLFVERTLAYPEAARENRDQGVAVVSFVIEVDGCLSQLKVVRSISEELDEEALRIVREMMVNGYYWNPGRHEGKPVRVQWNLPVKFQL